MITTLLLDIGGTVFIKDENENGIINPAITYLVEHLPESVEIVLVSDTDMFDVHDLLQKFMPKLADKKVFVKKEMSWIDKTKPETYLRVCELIHKKPSECILIDNQDDFRSAANASGIKTYDVHQQDIEAVLKDIN